jgi:autotransporter-associated beta strand protein/T5SS/PEP-CTERM-associated repeat protein
LQEAILTRTAGGHPMSCSVVACRRFTVCLAAILAAALSASPSFGQFTWSNAAGGNWSAASNWGGTGPAAGGSATTSLTFGTAGTQAATYTATNDLTGTFLLNSLTVNNTSGTVTVAGNALNFTGAAPAITVSGAGNLIISNPLTLSSTDATPNVTVGGAGGGAVTLSGAITGGTNNLVKTTSGSLTLSGGGTMNQLSLQNGNTFITGGTLSLTLADGTTNTAALELGTASGQTMAVTISGGATVNSFDNTFIGDATGSTGTLTVTGAGTVFNTGTAANSAATSGRLAVGNNSTGTLNVLAGAVVNCDRLFTSRLVGSTSTTLVDGVGSVLHVISQASIGNQANGTLTIQNGGKLQADNIFNFGNNALNQSTSVTVSGTGSLLSIGTASIVSNMQIGATAGSTGPFGVTVQNGGAITTTGQFQLLEGAITALIQSGGTVTVTGTTGGGAFIGTNAGTTTLTVTGANSLLTTPSSLVVGGSGTTPSTGTSTVTIDTGGTITATAGLAVYGPGTVNVNAGGTLNVGGVTDGTATSTGKINVATGRTLNITDGGGLTFTGLIAGAGGVTKGGAGTQTFAAANTYSGGTTVTGGTLAVTNANALGTGNLAVASGATVSSTVALTVPANATWSGAGTITAALTVPATARLTGGSGTAVGQTLTVTSMTFDTNSFFRAAVAPGGGATDNTTAGASRVAATGAIDATAALITSTNSPLKFELVNAGGLDLSGATTYTRTIATYANLGPNLTGAFGAGGGTVNAATPQITLTGTNFAIATNWSMVIGATGIVVTFTPVPEPATVLGLAAVAVVVVRLRRKFA